ncbi:MAG: riboflavin synthase [Gaiellaceae bacterium]
MFTGIVRELGQSVAAEDVADGLRLVVEAPATASLTGVGDSVSVNGCCLTAEVVEEGRLSFHVVPETLARTTLGGLSPGDRVNVEPALRAGDPLGGHYVQGHVDGIGRVRSVEGEGAGLRVAVEAPEDVLRYCVEKGSIAVDGVSLTIAAIADDAFEIALVPHTLEVTTLSSLRPGAQVNLEVDVFAKYVERLVPGGQNRGA